MAHSLPETVLQFGGGRFLRGFADLFIHHANQAGQAVGSIVVVQSTVGMRAEALNRQEGRYQVLVQGIEDGKVVDRVEESASIARAIIAQESWAEVLEAARSPQIATILSNTTEAGFTLDPTDTLESSPPQSFPAKLLAVLWARFQVGLAGVTILPCELLEGNADRLKETVLGLVKAWEMPTDFRAWLETSCRWRNTLVDRIVVDASPTHPLAEKDRLLISAEPFALWVIEQEEGQKLLEHPAVLYTGDVLPYFLRKVRILNGAHTAMAPRASAKGYETVKEAMADSSLRSWLEELLFEEIVPTVMGRVEEPEAFARQVLERFQNPFLEHKIANILVYHAQKQQSRLAPTLIEFEERFGKSPKRLSEALQT
jgi:tagaturonate reductase